ncbi:jg5229 [Pararge aegeria aegeria]|uniref:Jg5229 protein n=1 Tax=Pararge aegeria aegeria TaxID=348720 RepID=A0A8S4QE04_9NEOP|nr:jg5229 [Pararge aegeria aegeria]
MPTAGNRSFEGSSKHYGFVPLGSSGYLRLLDVAGPPRWGSTNAALTSAGLLVFGTPTSIHSPSYVPRLLPLQLCNSLSYVGNSGSSTDLFIPDVITQSSEHSSPHHPQRDSEPSYGSL